MNIKLPADLHVSRSQVRHIETMVAPNTVEYVPGSAVLSVSGPATLGLFKEPICAYLGIAVPGAKNPGGAGGDAEGAIVTVTIAIGRRPHFHAIQELVTKSAEKYDGCFIDFSSSNSATLMGPTNRIQKAEQDVRELLEADLDDVGALFDAQEERFKQPRGRRGAAAKAASASVGSSSEDGAASSSAPRSAPAQSDRPTVTLLVGSNSFTGGSNEALKVSIINVAKQQNCYANFAAAVDRVVITGRSSLTTEQFQTTVRSVKNLLKEASLYRGVAPDPAQEALVSQVSHLSLLKTADKSAKDGK